MVSIKENLQCFQYMFFYFFIVYSFIYFRLLAINSPEERHQEFIIKVMEQWKKKPIWKMNATNEDGEGPKGMEKYSFGIWNGINEGCNCSEKIRTYYPNLCSQYYLDYGCFNMNEQGPKNIYVYYFRYYVTYYDSDYLTLFSRVEKKQNISKCKSGYKKCGYLDSMRRPFCVKEEEDCVINTFYFFDDGRFIYLHYGFVQNSTETNYVINNLYVTDDANGCALEGRFLNDEFTLYKKNNKMGKCKPEKYDNNIFTYIHDSSIYKSYLYQTNNIYNGDGKIPMESSSSHVSLYFMTYYGLSEDMDEYYYSDVTIFKNLNLYNILIFIILKALIQLGYFFFIQKSIFKNRKYEIIFNVIWIFVFVTTLILIWLFNNSIYRTSLLFSLEDSGHFYEVMKVLRILDIISAFIILVVHIMKFGLIIINKKKKKFSEFINENK